MKDLKYLYEFEKLLESANNPLVQQACAEGKHALAYTCYHMPEVLLNTGDCFSVRLRAPLTGSLDISSYYMSNFICDYCKSLLERGIEGGYNFLSALLATETCSEMNRALYGERGVWVRPAAMWSEMIERGGQTVRRFTYIGE